MTDHDGPSGDGSLEWRLRALDDITDLVVAIDADARIVYANRFAGELLGYRHEDVLGTSMADYLHPDDLIRAIEVMGEIATDSLQVDVTPAMYRIRTAGGVWQPIEINAAPADTPEGRLLLVLGRSSGDRDLQDELLELLTDGVPADDMVDLIPRFGSWRHPHEHYAVWWRTASGRHEAVGSPVACALLGDPDLDLPEMPWARAIVEGTEVIVDRDDLPEALTASGLDPSLGTCWAVPVPDPLWDEPAVIVAWSRPGGPAAAVHRYSIELMTRALTLVLQWRSQVVDLHSAARRDALTGAPNRLTFFELFDSIDEIHDGPEVAVLYVDLDGFKAVNDSRGHRTGDAVLVQSVARMERVLRPGDVLARLGGDEFAVVCRHVVDVADAEALASRLVAAFHDPFVFDGERLTVGASVGIAVQPAASAVASDLLHDADRALYRAKAEGRGTWRVAGQS